MWKTNENINAGIKARKNYGGVTTETNYHHYWGKTRSEDNSYHPAAYHCLDVAAVGYTILSTNPLLVKRITNLTGWSSEESIRFVTFWLALHDLGKFTESFQGLNRDLFEKLNGRKNGLEYILRHDDLGFKLWKNCILKEFLDGRLDLLSPDVKSREAERILNSQANAVFGHHGAPPDIQNLEQYNWDQLYSKSDIRAVNEYVFDCKDLFFGDNPVISSLAPKKSKDFVKLSWILAGLAVFSDWIASDDKKFSYITEAMPLEVYWNKYALIQAKEAIDGTGLKNPEISSNTGVEEIFSFFKEKKKNLEPSPLQKYASDVSIGEGPHLFIIEESTGGGKTEAAITLAHRLMVNGDANGIYIGLPTMATANAMYSRLANCYRNLYSKESEPSLVLAHANRQYSENFLQSIAKPKYQGESVNEELSSGAICSNWLSDNRKKSLLSPVGAGTIDQALVSILPVKHQSLRLFGLLQNVLIVDEVHAYDSYMEGLLQTQLSFLAALGASVILLSATLPMEMKKSFTQSFANGAGYELTSPKSEEYPLVIHLSPCGLSEEPVSPRSGTERNVEVEIIDNEDEVKKKLIESLKRGYCACWIRNTVRDAVDTYHYFSRIVSPDKLSLFHSGFVMGDRIDIEDSTLQNFGKESQKEVRSGKLLIATQVIEQSLDLDFDYMVTDLCPIDLILQRAGRLHRHKRDYKRDNPVLWVYSPLPVENPDRDWYSRVFRGASFVYPKHGDLYLTAKILDEYGFIRTPGESRDLIEGVYGQEGQNKIPENLKDTDERDNCRRSSDKSLARENSLKLNSGYAFGGSKWGSDEDTPTRLIDPTVTLRLGIIDEKSGDIRPVDNFGKGRWDLSQVTVRKAKFPFEPVYDQALKTLIEKVNESMPDQCRWCTFLPLHDSGNSLYSNEFHAPDGEIFNVSYSQKEGIIISKS